MEQLDCARPIRVFETYLKSTQFSLTRPRAARVQPRVKFGAIHGSNIQCRFPVKKRYNSGWRSIIQEVDSLSKRGIHVLKYLQIKLGDGESTKFWSDSWCKEGVLKEKFPRVFALELCKNMNVADKVRQLNPFQTFRRIPRGGVEHDQFQQIDRISRTVNLNSIKDSWVWELDKSGTFSVASVRRFIDDTMIHSPELKSGWNNLVPSKKNMKITCEEVMKISNHFQESSQKLSSHMKNQEHYTDAISLKPTKPQSEWINLMRGDQLLKTLNYQQQKKQLKPCETYKQSNNAKLKSALNNQPRTTTGSDTPISNSTASKSNIVSNDKPAVYHYAPIAQTVSPIPHLGPPSGFGYPTAPTPGPITYYSLLPAQPQGPVQLHVHYAGPAQPYMAYQMVNSAQQYPLAQQTTYPTFDPVQQAPPSPTGQDLTTSAWNMDTDFMTRRVLLRCDSTGDLYPITAPSPIPHAFLVSQHTWHQRLGHSGRDVLRRIVFNNVIFCNKEKPLVFFHDCQLGKHVRLPFVSSNTVVTSCFDTIHSDVWTSPISSLSGFKYYVLFFDHYSQFVWVYPLFNKYDCDHGGGLDNRNLHKLFAKMLCSFDFLVPRHPNKMVFTSLGILMGCSCLRGNMLLRCERAHMVNCNPSRTPVDNESKLGADGDLVYDLTLYRSLAGSLQYLTFTRPDISYAVQQVCLYMHDPWEPYFFAFKRVLRYVRGTLDYRLHLFSSSTPDLVAYSDVDWAGCPTTRRSTYSYCVFLGKNLISWSSKRQLTLSRSSAEAEYRGVANLVAETCWLRNLLRELHTPLSSAILVYYDNVHILHVPSRYQFANIFTKGLPSALFEEFRSSLSVRCPPAPTKGEC
uniref:Ribonuclease H-like domain-containing protein n=1 Tax=Tanacetum cinerariifolium TaxID=118510 RepID=A0A6L2L6T3_TANCI|nr:ribonuclease H-like domain-containing protein [Tanacetum cinerariifolium]